MALCLSFIGLCLLQQNKTKQIQETNKPHKPRKKRRKKEKEEVEISLIPSKTERYSQINILLGNLIWFLYVSMCIFSY